MTHHAIEMYANASCPFCVAARNLLRSKDVTWTEVSVDAQPDRRAEMVSRSGRRTVPQIFIGERHIGGFDDLQALDEEGALDRLLDSGRESSS